MPSELDLHYPPDACPFCNIASAFPSPSSKSSSQAGNSATRVDSLLDCVPSDGASDPEKTTPSSFIILASKDVIAFLDILPMTRGHVLVATRDHRVKVEDMRGGEGREMGEFSLLFYHFSPFCKRVLLALL